MKISLQRALIALLATVALVALLPAGLILERQLAAEIERQVRADLDAVPDLATERQTQVSDAMMMHAKDIAQTPGLAEAMVQGNDEAAVDLADRARGAYAERVVLVRASGEIVAGPEPPSALVDRVRAGEMPVEIVREGATLQAMALAPVELPEPEPAFAGIAGIASTVANADAAALAAISRADVVLVAAGTPLGATIDSVSAVAAAAAGAAALAQPGTTHALELDGRRYLATATPLGPTVNALFLRDLDRELAIVGRWRRTVAIALAVALGFALLIGAFFAMMLTRPVRALAGAADRLAAGDFAAPVPRTALTELSSVTGAFDAMRAALASRLEELERVNRELEDRQRRLSALQSELIQRDRLAAAGHLVTQMAHEIRNPVANVRNCLELIRRRLTDAESREFADLAIDELLRMHELAEHMLDLHRPRRNGGDHARLGDIVEEVAALVRIGAGDGLTLDVHSSDPPPVAATPSDSVKQVLLNLVRNAREAMEDSGRIDLYVEATDTHAVIRVEDSGPGIGEADLPRIFDPFFTTKDEVHGVGLGLFVAEGIVRGMGGRISASNVDGGGARFTIELPLAAAPIPEDATSEARSGRT